MKMDINELVLQMTYAAAQMAQNTIPQTQEPTRTEDGKSFQNLMDEKRTERTERESKAPETTTAATQTAQQGQTAAAALRLDPLQDGSDSGCSEHGGDGSRR